MKALVTGGGGFLGTEIVRQLRARGDEVLAVGRGRYPAVEALGARWEQVDLSKPADLRPLCEGKDVVFHTAAKAGIWGPRESFYAINVTGTEAIANAAKAAGVPRFVHTSSPSAVFSKGHDALDASEEDCPFPSRYDAFYPETKALAEKWILAQNGPGFATTALRPHFIWGPGDPHLLPRIVDRYRRGRLVQVGPGDNKVSFTYVENAALAHLLAADALRHDAPPGGKAYFITDDEPVVFWDFVNRLLEALGEGRVTRKASYPLVRAVSSGLAAVWSALGIEKEPALTPFVVDQLAASHWYSSAAAKRDFGYHTVITHEEAFRRTIEAFRSG